MVVEDEATGTPLSGVPVQLRVRPGTSVLAATDVHGVVRFPGIPDLAKVMDVTAAPAEHGWVSHLRPRTRDLLVRVPALPSAEPHGYATRVTQPLRDWVEGLLLLSHTGDPGRLSLVTLPGPPVHVHATYPGWMEDWVAQMPSGATLWLQRDVLKETALAFVDSGCGPDARCPRVAVTFGFQAPLNEAPLLTALDASDAFLWERVPLFRRGVHAAEFRLLDRVTPAPVGGMTSTTSETPVVFPARQLALWQVPRLPALDGESPPQLMQLLVILGTLVPRLGFVPLGFDAVADGCAPTARWNCPLSPEQDGIISCAERAHGRPRCADLGIGQIRVSYAYPHDGLETFPLLAMFLASHPGDEERELRPTSVLFSHASSWAERVPGELAAPEFSGIPDGHWLPSLETFTVTTLPPLTDFIQLRAHEGRRTWSIYAPVPALPAVLELPPVPPGALAFVPLHVNLSAWRLASSSLAELSSIAGGGMRGLLASAAAVARRR